MGGVSDLCGWPNTLYCPISYLVLGVVKLVMGVVMGVVVFEPPLLLNSYRKHVACPDMTNAILRGRVSRY